MVSDGTSTHGATRSGRGLVIVTTHAILAEFRSEFSSGDPDAGNPLNLRGLRVYARRTPEQARAFAIFQSHIGQYVLICLSVEEFQNCLQACEGPD